MKVYEGDNRGFENRLGKVLGSRYGVGYLYQQVASTKWMAAANRHNFFQLTSNKWHRF